MRRRRPPSNRLWLSLAPPQIAPQTCCGNAPMIVLRVYHRTFSHRRRLASKPDLFPLQKRASAGQHNGAADVTSGQQSPRDEDDFLRSVSSDHVLRRRRHEPPRLGRSNSDGNPAKLCTRKVLAGHRPKIPNTNSAGTNETSASRRDRILATKGIVLSASPKIRSKLEAYQAKPWKLEGTCGAS